ncbi:MAG: right-handed parallel beta-helix repeat-containing protein [Deltaproteobacteria bacterium]|nr:right-handed parallel beta-helix repeat-containing protein [Deltaproteobacteria bacterium]
MANSQFSQSFRPAVGSAPGYQRQITLTVNGLWMFALLVGWLLPSVGEATTFKLTCTAKKTIQSFIPKLKPGDTLLVTGTCNENVVIPEQVHNVTLDGQGTATINGPDTTRATVQIRGDGITMKGFTVSGGRQGILVTRNGAATIDDNAINCGNTTLRGIVVNQNSSARIVNNTVENCVSDGILIGEGSSARIGFLNVDDTTASPNTIQNNGEDGVHVLRSSDARVVGNTIQNNTGDGVAVRRASHADISSNIINGNGEDGIEIGGNSGVNLGSDSGDGILDAANSTTVNNGGFGVRCVTNSSADGRLGSVNGGGGAKSFAGSCVDSLL